LKDCTDEYVTWLNNPEVSQYMETKWYDQNIESIKCFVESQRNNSHSYLFAIIHCDDDRHIGNIKIGPIHPHYQHADISYFIGDTDFWHKGIATEAIELVCKFGFEELYLHRIEAGAYACAIGSWKALENNGFRREGIFREQILFKQKYIDVYRYGLLKDEYKRLKDNK
jgi:RimJ/RimL family protein N-acetyltransferase